MNVIEVCAAIIIKEKSVFVAQRNYGDFAGKWEFPGGKVKDGETGEECIIREIEEELGVEIEVIDLVSTIPHSYPKFKILLHSYLCKLKNNQIVLHEHSAAKFVDIDELDNIDLLPADLSVLETLKRYLAKH